MPKENKKQKTKQSNQTHNIPYHTLPILSNKQTCHQQSQQPRKPFVCNCRVCTRQLVDKYLTPERYCAGSLPFAIFHYSQNNSQFTGILKGKKIENTLTICRPLEIKQSIDGVAHDHTYIFLHIYTTHHFLDGLSSFQDTVPFSNTIEVEAAKQGFQDPLQSSQLLQLEFHGFLFKLFNAII